MKNNAKNWQRIVPMFAFAVLVAAAMIMPANAEVLPGKPSVSPLDSVVHGKTYGEWSAAWQQWASSISVNKHPLFDTPPSNPSCAEGQSGPVWFLGGRFCGTEEPTCNSSLVVRSCTVPAGKSLFFPVLNISCLDAEAKNGFCFNAAPFITEMRAEIAGVIDKTRGLTVTVDGKPIKSDLKKDFRVQSTGYQTLLPENNLYEAIGEPVIVAGSYLGVDDGIYVMLDPLKKGQHTLNFKGTFPQFNFSLDVTYHLTIE
jgi:hypothetical protein